MKQIWKIHGMRKDFEGTKNINIFSLHVYIIYIYINYAIFNIFHHTFEKKWQKLFSFKTPLPYVIYSRTNIILSKYHAFTSLTYTQYHPVASDDEIGWMTVTNHSMTFFSISIITWVLYR